MIPVRRQSSVAAPTSRVLPPDLTLKDVRMRTGRSTRTAL